MVKKKEIPFGRSPDMYHMHIERWRRPTYWCTTVPCVLNDGAVAKHVSSRNYLGGDVNVEVCPHHPMTHSVNVNPHRDARRHPPRPHQPDMASTPLDHENPVMVEAKLGIL